MSKAQNEIEEFIYKICYRPIWESLNNYIAAHPTTLNFSMSRIKYPDTAMLLDMLLEYATHIRIDEDWLKSALNTLFKSLLDDRESFFTLVETRCNSIIKEYIRNTSGIVLEEVENRLDELKQERERLKTLAVKALITMDEAEHDMIPINEEIEKLSFRLNETNKTREITQKIKASIQAFLNTFSAFDFSGNITNEELKKVVKEIRVVSKNEIYVYFNIAEDIEGLNFPINISDVVEIDTNSNNRAQRCT